MSTKRKSVSKQQRVTGGEQARLGLQKSTDADIISQWLYYGIMHSVVVYVVC